MDAHERLLLQNLHALQAELFTFQSNEIEALRKANESLRRSHDVIGQMLKITADLVRVS
jgi:hypothetical protein